MSELFIIRGIEDPNYIATWRQRTLAKTLFPIIEAMDDHFDVAETLKEQLTTEPIGADIRDIDTDAYMAFVRAADQVGDRFISEDDPLTSLAYLELDVLLHKDERCTYQKYSDADTGQIEVGTAGVWSVPLWVYKLVVSKLCYLSWWPVYFDKTDNETWWHLFWEAKDRTLCSLQDEELKHDEILREAMELLGSTYAQGKGNTGAGTLFNEKLYPAAAELYELYKSAF
jgi:hypothetical protein